MKVQHVSLIMQRVSRVFENQDRKIKALTISEKSITILLKEPLKENLKENLKSSLRGLGISLGYTYSVKFRVVDPRTLYVEVESLIDETHEKTVF